MKHDATDNQTNGGDNPLEEDALWDLLGKASEREADPFFSRNVVRAARQLPDALPTWRERVASVFFSKKAILPVAAAACVGIFVVSQLQTGPPATTPPANDVAHVDTPPEPATALAELVIDESLIAAADDPSQFTHDEVVAMVGL